jgi:hypothetical protein
MRSLRVLQEEWLDFPLNDDDAAPFLAYAPPTYRSQPRRILYVGKATEHSYERKHFTAMKNAPMDTRIKERLDLAETVFRGNRLKTGASFWGFANDLSRAVDPACADLANLAWSNLCKVGTESGLPEDSSIARQSSLAAETIKREIENLRPSIVVVVSSHFAERNILLKTFDTENPRKWNKSEEDESKVVDDVWWLEGAPPVIWMRHPQFAPGALRKYAIEKAVELLG